MNVLLVIIGLLASISLNVCAVTTNETDIIPYNRIENRIIDGKRAKLGDIPWQVSILSKLRRSSRRPTYFGGVLISISCVVTVAQWCDGYNEFNISMGTIVLGEKNGYFRSTRDCKMHERYNRKTLQNDHIAVLRFSGFFWTLQARPIDLPSGAEKLYVNALATASGWGWQASKNNKMSKYLNYIKPRVISNNECRKYLKNVYSTTLCAKDTGKKNTSHGDAGGPLTVNINGKPILVGIISFGSKWSCQKGVPFANIRISKYIKWINKNKVNTK